MQSNCNREKNAREEQQVRGKNENRKAGTREIREENAYSENARARRLQEKKCDSSMAVAQERKQQKIQTNDFARLSEIKIQKRKPLPPAGLVYGKAKGETVQAPRFAEFSKVFKINPYPFQNEQNNNTKDLA